MNWRRHLSGYIDRNKNAIYAGILVASAIAMIMTTQSPAQMNAAKPADRIYGNCDHARAEGAAPIMRGEPGYRPALDRDNDGVACEPWRYSAN